MREETPEPPQPADEAAGEPIDDLALGGARRWRNPLLAVAGGAMVVVGLLVIWSTSDSLGYYFESATPRDLGKIEDALAKGKLVANRHVKFSGIPRLASEGKIKRADRGPGCLRGPQRRFHYSLIAATGDRVVVRAPKSLGALPKRTTFSGRLIRIADDARISRLYRGYLYRLTDCRRNPSCDKSLLVSTDFSAAELRAKVGRKQTQLRSKTGHAVPVSPGTRILVNLRHPGEYEYGLLETSRADATAKVRSLGVPFHFLEADGAEQKFVIVPPPALAQRLIRAHKRGSGYTISRRTSSFYTAFGSLETRGDQLRFNDAAKTFPRRFQLRAPADGQAKLVALPATDQVDVPWDHVTGAGYYGPRRLPHNAWLLQIGVTPRRAWGALVVGGLGGTAGLLGLVFVLLGLRRPR